MKISNKVLQARFKQAADILKWNITDSHTLVDNHYRCVVGFVFLQNSGSYWHINKYVSDGGGETVIADACSRNEMYSWLSGIIYAHRILTFATNNS